MVIETSLADRNDARICSQLLHLVKMPRLGFGGVVRVDSNACPNPVMNFSDRDSTPHVVRPASVADCQDPSNPAIPGSLKYSIAICVEARIIQVCMRINQHSLQSRAVG